MSPLTLTLQPGLRFPSTVVVPPADMPPGPVVLALPLYPGAQPTTARFRSPMISHPGTPYLKTGIVEYMMPASVAAVTQWYDQAFAACGDRLVS